MRFKPQAHITKDEYIPYECRRVNVNKVIIYDTYQELKKNIKGLMEMSVDDTVYVVRSKKGQWGEWFEWWTLENNQPTIIEQGWN